jgi:small GTP-binding protein
MSYLKVLVVGDVSTGKTSLVTRLVSNSFQETYKSTIGCEFASKLITLNSEIRRVQLWDLAGQDRLGAITKLYCRDAHGILVVADLSRAETVGRTTKWKAEVEECVKEANGRSLPMVLCLNKCDLVETPEHATEQLQALVRENGFAGGFFTSAKTGYNANEAFACLITMITKRNAENITGNQPSKHPNITLALKHINRKSCC